MAVLQVGTRPLLSSIGLASLTVHSSIRVSLYVVRLRNAFCATDNCCPWNAEHCVPLTLTHVRGLFQAINDITDLFERLLKRNHLYWIPSSVGIGSSAIPLAICSLNTNLTDLHFSLDGMSGLTGASPVDQQRRLITLMKVVQEFDCRVDGISSISTIVNNTLDQMSLHLRSFATLTPAGMLKENASLLASRQTSLIAIIHSSYLSMALAIDSNFQRNPVAGRDAISTNLVDAGQESVSKRICGGLANAPTARSANLISKERLAQWIANDRSLHFACEMEASRAATTSQSPKSLECDSEIEWSDNTGVCLDWG